MRRLLLVAMFMLFGMSAAIVHADENAPLGRGNVAVKLGGVIYYEAQPSHEAIGLTGGVEAYMKVTDTLPLYLGGEFSLAGEHSSSYNVDSMRGVIYELNVKYAKKTRTPPFDFVVDIGGGVSYTSAEHIERSPFFGVPSVTTEDGLLGAQIFVDVIDVMNDWFMFGFNLKYHVTQKFEGLSDDFSNLRGTLLVGVVF